MLYFFSAAAESVWQGTVLASYLYMLYDGSNTAVGAADAAKGGFTLLVALPIG